MSYAVPLRNGKVVPADRRVFQWVDFSMSEATKLIVEGYSTLKDRKGLEDLREHRQRLRKQLQDKPKGWIDVGPST
jgi:hypothetical protein